MRVTNNKLTCSPTDVADFLACRHKTTLELAAARGEMTRPEYTDPLSDVLRKRGLEHEQRYVDALRGQGLSVVDLKGVHEWERTLDAMRTGADVIVQAPLGVTADDAEPGWFGYADVLRKVTGESHLGWWHYEALDTKLSRETRAGALLQLSVYTRLLGRLQGRIPSRFHVVTPAGAHAFRTDDVAAYFRLIERQMRNQLESPAPDTYPEPVEHCGVCRWWAVCEKRRRADDHIQYVANLGRNHQRELSAQGVSSLAALAAWEVPDTFRPVQGARTTYVKLQEQAALQLKQRESGRPQYTLLPLAPAVADDGTPLPPRGLKRLPEPSPGDLYLDLEGDPFGRPVVGGEAGDGSREYLFGLGSRDDQGGFRFRRWWAFSDHEERLAFEALMDEMARVFAVYPGAHLYHYAPYEPSALKRLSGRYATRGQELDELLRGGRLVDLYAVVRESVRAGVETYSIKSMEPFYNFSREIDLRQAGHERQAIEAAIETGTADAIPQTVRDAVEGYNRDDVRSTVELQRWLESLRSDLLAQGQQVPRPVAQSGEPPEKVKDRDVRVAELRARLLQGVAVDDVRDPRYLMAYLLDWHRREAKSEWWEFYRLRDLDSDALLEERKGIAGLEYVERVDIVRRKDTGRPTGSVIDRYRFPPQECDVKTKDTLRIPEGPWATVVDFDRWARTVDVKVGEAQVALRPSAAFIHDVIGTDAIADTLLEMGTALMEGRLATTALALLERRPPERVAESPRPGDVLAIQGPPGTGKTYQGSVMICELVAAGKSVGVTANSHAVITNLLRSVREVAAERLQDMAILQIKNEDEFGADAPRVIGGTTWHWCGKHAVPVDVMVVDEAGQMSLANALACTSMAGAMVLLGDPQQLSQPAKGVHPDGVGGSVLEFWTGGFPVMPEGHGRFLGTTWRMAPPLCEFTSESFYEGKLDHKPGLERQVLQGIPEFAGAGLRLVAVSHEGNRNASDEEASEVVRIVSTLLTPGSEWIDGEGQVKRLTARDILIVAPYNAHVSRIQDALAEAGLAPGAGGPEVGTVDKFQGQEAAVVIYSMATSRPEDAPRGLGFLYSLNRFNVATSRARCLCILVANPRLFEPECQTPSQMYLANAMCRYRELAAGAD